MDARSRIQSKADGVAVNRGGATSAPPTPGPVNRLARLRGKARCGGKGRRPGNQMRPLILDGQRSIVLPKMREVDTAKLAALAKQMRDCPPPFRVCVHCKELVQMGRTYLFTGGACVLCDHCEAQPDVRIRLQLSADWEARGGTFFVLSCMNLLRYSTSSAVIGWPLTSATICCARASETTATTIAVASVVATRPVRAAARITAMAS